MGKDSKIEWTHHTFNPWLGCTKVSEGCRNCYAETLMADRYKKVKWGPGAPRQRTTPAYWRQPLKWDREAAAAHERRRVFCASLADVFDLEVATEWRKDLFHLIEKTPNLDWLILTKRPEVMRDFMRVWGTPPNVWLGVSVEDQKTADARIPVLLDTPGAIRFVSYEPALGPVDFSRWLGYNPVHEIINAGRSGLSSCDTQGTNDRPTGAGLASEGEGRGPLGRGGEDDPVQEEKGGERHRRISPGPRDGGRHTDALLSTPSRLETLQGVDTPGLTINHKDGKKKRNVPSNLELATHSDQMRHMIDVLKKGRVLNQNGEKNSMAKLTVESVREIKRRRKAGEPLKAIATAFGVSDRTVSKIALGQRWVFRGA